MIGEAEAVPAFRHRIGDVVRVIGDIEESVVMWRKRRWNGRVEYYLRLDWAKRSLWWPEYLLDTDHPVGGVL